MNWEPIETVPEGEHVLLWFPQGERGNGGMETATVIRHDDGGLSFWSHGGPNSGMDFEPSVEGDLPTHWMKLPEPPAA